MSTRWTQNDIDRITSRIGGKMEVAIKPKFKFYVGIDCGVETGLAVWNAEEKKLIEVKTLMIHQAIEVVKNWIHLHAFIRVEDARKREYLPKEKNDSEYRGKLMGAGSVMRDSKIWEEFLTDMFNQWQGVHFEMVAPKSNKTKLGAEEFQKITGWKKRCSVHARDAAMLVYGF
jgi:hypothetical protein